MRRMPGWLLRTALLTLNVGWALGSGCRSSLSPAVLTPTAAVSPAPVFDEVSDLVGIRFRHVNGASGQKLLPETLGSGCAVVDVDQDGRQDVLLVDGTTWPGEVGPRGQTRLYRNRGGGQFEDVTERFRLPGGMFGMGVAVGDYDNDGYPDLFLTALGEARLLRNVHGEWFEDVTRRCGIRTSGWPTSAAFLDYDHDGRLDLFVCRYVQWSPERDRQQFYTLDGVNKAYARADSFPSSQCQLFRNEGNRFEDVSVVSGIARASAKALGVAVLDFDADGWIDLAVSNDMAPNLLFHNQSNGTFKELAVQAGVAVAEAGEAKSGRGIDAEDYDNQGREALLVSNFAGEQLSLYRRDPSGLFIDVAARTGVGIASQRYQGFGTFFFDADLDGRSDIFVANGHIHDDIAVRSSESTYAQPALLLLNTPEGRYRDVSAQAGALHQPRVGRGAAYGDLDGDGDYDIVLATNGGRAAIFRQRGTPRNHWVSLRLEGRTSNRSAIGANVRLRVGNQVQTRMVRSGSSYLSQSTQELIFGLGAARRVDDLEVRWPNGNLEDVVISTVDRAYRIVEGSGIALPVE